ncbi:hypothetical protein OJ967_25805 [Peribacillus frigoritolerans]|uniref:hypothetical protein n=1 Tax=Peribacillus frigoritolerans TaxID=450367 RepID=UPI002226A88C|nr:hypothetical protein [Peribacillus frigoritolerans]UYY98719.1 hypothetical protein OJ967_25805 [Peribacillus frigoritolerans]
MRTMLNFSENGKEHGIDNMSIWMIFCGLECLVQGDKRFFADKEELQNNVKYIGDYLNEYGKNAVFQNRWTKPDAKKYLAILSKLSK